LLTIAPSVDVTVGVPQASVAVAVPRAELIVAVEGLHPSASALPVAVMTGAVTSTVHVAVLAIVDVLPQPSVAVHVLVCVRLQLLVTIAPSVEVIVGVPQASVADAVPSAPSIAAVEGLHPSVKLLPVAVSVGAVTSTVHVAVLDVVEVLPQPSVAVNVLTWLRKHPFVTIAPSVDVTVGVPQASVAVAVPSAPFIVAVDGLHPSARALPVAVMTGAVISIVQVTVRDVVDELPHASVAVHVLVCERLQLLVDTVPSEDVSVIAPQASVAVAVPSAASIAAVDGLHPGVNVVPVAVITGGVLSFDQVTVRDVVDVLPQASVAVKVLVCVVLQPEVVCGPSLCVTVGVPQASVAVALPSAALIVGRFGLPQINSVVPVAVITGGVVSSVHVAVLDAVELLPHASVAVHVLVCDLLHPLLTIAPSVDVIVGVPQASVAVAVPSAASIAAVDGLQPGVNVVPVAVSVGAVTSMIHVAVLDTVETLPHASVAVHVLVCDLPQPLLTIAPSVEVIVGVPQSSVALAVPSAPLIVAVAGLHPSASVLPVAVMVGAVTSTVHVIVLDAVDVLPHASAAVHDLVCDLLHPLLTTAPSVDVTVGVPQASVAVALPRAELIAAVVGLQPGVRLVPVAVSVGGVISTVHVAVLDVVAVLPQPSVAVHILVCVRLQLLLTIVPSVDVSVGVPQTSVAVAVPSAPSIAAVEGLHPSASVLPVAVIVGAVISTVHVMVLEVVDELPHPSAAVHVLVCDLLHPLLTIVPSVEVIVGVPQASVAVAVPSAELIADVEGLHPNASVVPVAVMVGGVISSVHVAVLDAVDVLPHASFAVQDLVCERLHPVLIIAPSVDVTVGAPQPSVAVAVPSAELIVAVEGLHPSASALPVAVSVGAVLSVALYV
jgi:hypothetical protein